MWDKIVGFFKSVGERLKKQVRKFWAFLQQEVFPPAKALIFGELKDYALYVVARLQETDLDNDARRKSAFESIKTEAAARGMTIKDSMINLLVEIIVAKLKNEAENIGS